MLPTASTLIRPAVVATFGTVIGWDPSFEVPATRAWGDVCPPSTERRILTFVAPMGEVRVLATFHLMVFFWPAFHF